MIYFSVILGIYIGLEAINELAMMDKGDRAYLVFRYVLCALGGLMISYYGAKGEIDWLHIGLAVTISLFMLPKIRIRVDDFITRAFAELEQARNDEAKKHAEWHDKWNHE